MKQERIPGNITIERMPCPACGRGADNVTDTLPVRVNFTIYPHLHRDGSGHRCLGASPEIILTCLLRQAGLDVRPDADSRTLPEDPAWLRKQREVNSKEGRENETTAF